MSKKRVSRWDQLCEQVETDDGLPCRPSGSWAQEKLYKWNRYVEITTTAMVGHSAWKGGVVYVDLFAGPGVCELRGSDRRFPGSPLIAGSAPKPFSKVLLCELSRQLADACRARLARMLPDGQYEVFQGDCNSQINELVRAIPKGALTLAFLDPTGLHLWFETVEVLSRCGRVDLLVLFPDAVDIIRNDEHLYFGDLDSNLDRFLGFDSDWRSLIKTINYSNARERCRLYADIYRTQLQRRAGYKYFADEVIRGPKGPLYRLIYATKDQRGIDFWNKSVAKEFRGQQRFDFG